MTITRDSITVIKQDKKLFFSQQTDSAISFFRQQSGKRVKLSGGNDNTPLYLAALSQQKIEKKIVVKKFANNGAVYPELVITPNVKHPNILSATLLSDSKHYYLMMPYHEHGSLFDLQPILIKACYANIRRYILQQIIDALIYLAEHNIAHQDLHPGNILVDTDLNIQIIDFGRADHIDSTKPIFGQFIYPESDELNTHKTDGYMFAMTILDEWIDHIPHERLLTEVSQAMKFPLQLVAFKQKLEPYIQLNKNEIEQFFMDAKSQRASIACKI